MSQTVRGVISRSKAQPVEVVDIVIPDPGPGEVVVDSAVLLFRSRGDVHEPAVISAGREDVLRRVGGGLQLARRTITVDESVLRTQNLAIFL